MKIVHFSTTPLAGMPLRLVQALQKYTEHEVHLIDLKDDYNRGNYYFGYDISFNKQQDEAIELAYSADIIHLHNYLDFDSKFFAPINFRELHKKGTFFVRQFHSTPALIAKQLKISVKELLAQNIPSLVIAQYPERYFPQAMVVPNFVPQDEELYLPVEENELKWDIFYSSTQNCGAFDARWDTKGMPETKAMLERLEQKTACRIKTASFSPFTEVMTYKRQSAIVLDDMATGSYHLTGLEGLAMAKPVLSYMDSRAKMLMRYFSGSDHEPHINTRFEEAEAVLAYLMNHKELMRDIGEHSRNWLKKYWSDKKMVGFYEDVYQKLVHDPSLIRRQPDLDTASPVQNFMNKTLHDLRQITRAENYGSASDKLRTDISSLEP
ncbi:glycosyltransferase [Maridesulfovibrio bastinii]|uniref:glycosyltransferase n=1 Tax=Maridesulfovibrio bastinii TaxID=47157 RepID=UPI0004258830|nr:glycosyltransferase [Maridesulfovibrio bastinii]